MKKGDLCKVLKSKFIETGSVVEILAEIQKDIYLVGLSDYSANYICVARNLEPMED
ncbi:hypothetical protein [Candidatus Enterococcus courvalinii]|uniref:Uncharacterized protein n=1 Tax=Candidatus Enterococcus courvalinii TaxID=2815329 RepID=A0ABS3HZG4_9ENTE|nr:hypothetical protein [Enterococcus sp. MSG2901]MBO0481806.1 hypothetical protein [Enterococcus sp. MSG2901]